VIGLLLAYVRELSVLALFKEHMRSPVSGCSEVVRGTKKDDGFGLSRGRVVASVY